MGEVTLRELTWPKRLNVPPGKVVGQIALTVAEVIVDTQVPVPLIGTQ